MEGEAKGKSAAETCAKSGKTQPKKTSDGKTANPTTNGQKLSSKKSQAKTAENGKLTPPNAKPGEDSRHLKGWGDLFKPKTSSTAPAASPISSAAAAAAASRKASGDSKKKIPALESSSSSGDSDDSDSDSDSDSDDDAEDDDDDSEDSSSSSSSDEEEDDKTPLAISVGGGKQIGAAAIIANATSKPMTTADEAALAGAAPVDPGATSSVTVNPAVKRLHNLSTELAKRVGLKSASSEDFGETVVAATPAETGKDSVSTPTIENAAASSSSAVEDVGGRKEVSAPSVEVSKKEETPTQSPSAGALNQDSEDSKSSSLTTEETTKSLSQPSDQPPALQAAPIPIPTPALSLPLTELEKSSQKSTSAPPSILSSTVPSTSTSSTSISNLSTLTTESTKPSVSTLPLSNLKSIPSNLHSTSSNLPSVPSNMPSVPSNLPTTSSNLSSTPPHFLTKSSTLPASGAAKDPSTVSGVVGHSNKPAEINSETPINSAVTASPVQDGTESVTADDKSSLISKTVTSEKLKDQLSVKVSTSSPSGSAIEAAEETKVESDKRTSEPEVALHGPIPVDKIKQSGTEVKQDCVAGKMSEENTNAHAKPRAGESLSDLGPSPGQAPEDKKFPTEVPSEPSIGVAIDLKSHGPQNSSLFPTPSGNATDVLTGGSTLVNPSIMESSTSFDINATADESLIDVGGVVDNIDMPVLSPEQLAPIPEAPLSVDASASTCSSSSTSSTPQHQSFPNGSSYGFDTTAQQRLGATATSITGLTGSTSTSGKPTSVAIVHKKRGRPKGSKNKPKPDKMFPNAAAAAAAAAAAGAATSFVVKVPSQIGTPTLMPNGPPGLGTTNAAFTQNVGQPGVNGNTTTLLVSKEAYSSMQSPANNAGTAGQLFYQNMRLAYQLPQLPQQQQQPQQQLTQQPAVAMVTSNRIQAGVNSAYNPQAVPISSIPNLQYLIPQQTQPPTPPPLQPVQQQLPQQLSVQQQPPHVPSNVAPSEQQLLASPMQQQLSSPAPQSRTNNESSPNHNHSNHHHHHHHHKHKKRKSKDHDKDSNGARPPKIPKLKIQVPSNYVPPSGGIILSSSSSHSFTSNHPVVLPQSVPQTTASSSPAVSVHPTKPKQEQNGLSAIADNLSDGVMTTPNFTGTDKGCDAEKKSNLNNNNNSCRSGFYDPRSWKTPGSLVVTDIKAKNCTITFLECSTKKGFFRETV